MDKRFKEKEVENIIENHLLNKSAYVKGVSADYHKEYCIDTAKLYEFLKDTQPEQFAALQKQSIANLQKETELMQEYRTRLISDAVFGKIIK